MMDINGSELRPHDLAKLLVEIVGFVPGGAGVIVRVLNSEEQLAVGARIDEALGGLVADSELTLFEPQLVAADGTAFTTEPQSHGESEELKRWPME